MTTTNKYDYIIAGTGASGLMLAYRMCLDPWFADKKILLLDKDQKDTNDRTWCYWEKGTGEWDSLLTKTWDNILFNSPTFTKKIPLEEYSYKMVRSKDLYRFLLNTIIANPNLTIRKEKITAINDRGMTVSVITNQDSYTAKKCLSSIFDPTLVSNQTTYPYLKQHFVGWFIETKKDVFDTATATFMDFTIAQKGNTRFMYVLPLSPNLALVEYTLFSEDLLPVDEYEREIKSYLSANGITDYEIVEKEMGNIPMTSYPFEQHNTKNILNIGSAGGWTKASTGYTFANTTKKSEELCQWLKSNEDFTKFHHRNRYWYYDLIMLDVLYKNNSLGSAVFTSIFSTNKIHDIFLFLDEQNSFTKDLKIMLYTSPRWNFTFSGCKMVFKKIIQKI